MKSPLLSPLGDDRLRSPLAVSQLRQRDFSLKILLSGCFVV